MPVKKYIHDSEKIEFREHRVPGKVLAIRIFAGFIVSLGLSLVYFLLISKMFGSPKQTLLEKEVEIRRHEFAMMMAEMEHYSELLEDIRISDEVRFRPVLELDPVDDEVRSGGMGGLRRHTHLEGYASSDVMIAATEKLSNIRRRAAVQSRSFGEVRDASDEWNRRLEHLPLIRPVRSSVRMGDVFGIRSRHPVTGRIGVPHRGQDFRAPLGTNIYATGAGTVTEAGWSIGGYGYYVKIDHGFGYESLYAHLSKIEVSEGDMVVRGDLVGLSGSTGVSTGPHLHYEVIYRGVHRDPRNYFHEILTDAEYKDMISARNTNLFLAR